MFGPLLAAGLFSSMAGSAIGAAQNNNNIRRQLAFQKAENQKTREYNMMLARYQNQENLAQWNRQNQYNLPEKQMQRLRQAGLNPDLMYSNGTVGNSMSSPEMTSGAPASPMDYSALGGMRTFGDVVTQTLNNEMQRAQIEAIKANTNKTKEETTGVILANENLTYKNLVDAATTGQKIEMENLNVKIAKNALDIGAKNLEKLGKELTTLDQTIKQNDEQLKILQNVVAGGALDNELKRKEVDNYLVKLNNDLLNDETMRKYQKAMTAKQWQEFKQDSLKFQRVLLGMDLDNGLKAQQGRINALNIRYKKAETGMLELEFDEASFRQGLKTHKTSGVGDFFNFAGTYFNYVLGKVLVDAPNDLLKFFK